LVDYWNSQNWRHLFSVTFFILYINLFFIKAQKNSNLAPLFLNGKVV
jgi:hypothetical protein